MEIERKYLLTPSQLKALVSDPSDFELETRYYLYCKDDNEIRITRRDVLDAPTYTLDRMEILHKETGEYFVRRKERIEIQKDEFESMISLLTGQVPIKRLHLKLNEQVELKVYQGELEGLIRAEVEFKTIEDAEGYTPEFDHSGEITNTPIGRDVLLAGLTKADLLAYLKY